MLANLLGQLGIRVVVLERDSDVYVVPRATHIDEETLRNFQATGLIFELLPHTELFGTIQVVDERGRVMMTDVVEDAASPHGYRGSRFFDQPAFERILRAGLARYPSVTLRTGIDVERVADTASSVAVSAKVAATSEPLVVHAAWAVGCDGGRSIVRASAGIEMESTAKRRPWVIVDTLVNDMADAAELPNCFTYYLKRDRLAIHAHGFGRNRRWEFQLGDGRADPANDVVLGWLADFVDPGKVEITRIVSYEHTALVAASWRAGRLLVAGDAAHMMPPSAGQGMCSGIRDAVNLAWKLERVVSGAARPELLATYECERAPHVREVLDGTLFINKRLQGDTAFQRWRRRNELRFAMAVPRFWEHARRRGIRRPVLRDGFRDAGSPSAGTPLPQFEVSVDGGMRMTDDVIGYRFALIAAPGSLSADDVAWADTRGIVVWRIGDELGGPSGPLATWMETQNADFVLVRPDRFVFAAGAARDISRAREAFDGWGAPLQAR